MKKQVWVLLAIAVVLLMWGFVRERFEPTQSIKAPPYDDAEKKRILNMMPPADKEIYRKSIESNTPGVDGREARVEKAVLEIPPGIVARFYNEVYKPATTPITQAQIDTFIESGQFWPAEGAVLKRLLASYFMSGVGTSIKTGYADALAELGQGQGYAETASSPNPPPPTGFYKTGELSPYGGGGYDVPDTGSVPGGGKGTETGTTTGGTSTSSYGPTSGGVGTAGGTGTGALIDGYGSVNGKQVYGPAYSGHDTSSLSGGRVDTSRTTRYPELLGGMIDTSTRIPGVGVVAPSKNFLLTTDGSLPSSCSLGSDANSSFFPTSRCPGDMDVIPDPYRVSRNFSTASYSSKTEPVPFLTDFSAFLK